MGVEVPGGALHIPVPTYTLLRADWGEQSARVCPPEGHGVQTVVASHGPSKNHDLPPRPDSSDVCAVYVCAHVYCMCVHVYVCMNVLHVCMCAICMCVLVCSMYVHVHTYVHTYMSVKGCRCVCVCMCVCAACMYVWSSQGPQRRNVF